MRARRRLDWTGYSSVARFAMNIVEVERVLGLFASHKLACWIDGGWGVDALLGRQTRIHDDLDLAVDADEMPAILKLLFEVGYLIRSDEMPARLELVKTGDARIDLHPLHFNERGDGIQKLRDGSVGIYTAEGLAGMGSINGKTVKCLSASIQLEFHCGYQPDDNDRHDVALLCEAFGLGPPSQFQ